MPTKDFSTRAAYESSYSWMRAMYWDDEEAAHQMCLTPETRAAKSSFIQKFDEFTGWVDQQRRIKFLEKRYGEIPF